MRWIQLGSLLVFGLFAFWQLSPWLRRLPRGAALTVLLWPHALRYTVLMAPAAQHAGYAISDTAIREAIIGDLIGAAIALTAIYALKRRNSLGVALGWLLVVETLVDVGVVIHRRLLEPLIGEPTTSLYLVLGFLVPVLIITIPMLIWQLQSRRNEAL